MSVRKPPRLSEKAPTWYTVESLQRIARAGYRNLSEYARSGESRRSLSAMLKGFQWHGIPQAEVIMHERVRITMEYAAATGCSLRRAARATGWYAAADWRRTWRRLMARQSA